MLVIIAKGLFLLQIDTFLRKLTDVGGIDIFTLLFLVFYFDRVQFRMLCGHRQGLLLLQNNTYSTEFLYVLNDKLSKLAGIKWKYAVLMIIMMVLMFFSQINGLPPKLLNYLGILSPIIIILTFVLSFQHFQRMLQNIQQFEQLLLVENNASTFKPINF